MTTISRVLRIVYVSCGIWGMTHTLKRMVSLQTYSEFAGGTKIQFQNSHFPGNIDRPTGILYSIKTIWRQIP